MNRYTINTDLEPAIVSEPFISKYSSYSVNEFDRIQKIAEQTKGIVMPGLNTNIINVLNVKPHSFNSDKPLVEAQKWAEENLVGIYTAYKGTFNEFQYQISRSAIHKYLQPSATNKSVNIFVHLSALKVLPTIIDASIETEIHADYTKINGVRSVENPINKDVLIIYPNIFVSTKELIKGTGGYAELDELYNAWNNNVKDCVLIHGHRNVFGIDTKVNDNIYNLCSGIEIGEPLRILEIGDTIEVKLVPNTVFDKNCHFDKTEQIDFKEIKSDNEIIDSLNKSKLIKKKLLIGGIVSYNFNRDAFYSRKWNELTCTARGLFVDLKTQKIIARSYNKFFNWAEVKETESPSLKQNLNFPVKAYKKENGFLALISYNWNNDTLLVCSKSTNDGDYVGYINQQLAKKTEEEMAKLKEYLKVSGTTLVFECVDIVNDPHIIKYNESGLYLLDEIKNSFIFEKTTYDKLQNIAKSLNFKCKQLEYTFNTWDELYAFKKQQDTSYDIRHEGWVFEDVKGVTNLKHTLTALLVALIRKRNNQHGATSVAPF